jgi:hypothetical protein
MLEHITENDVEAELFSSDRSSFLAFYSFGNVKFSEYVFPRIRHVPYWANYEIRQSGQVDPISGLGMQLEDMASECINRYKLKYYASISLAVKAVSDETNFDYVYAVQLYFDEIHRRVFPYREMAEEFLGLETEVMCLQNEKRREDHMWDGCVPSLPEERQFIQVVREYYDMLFDRIYG